MTKSSSLLFLLSLLGCDPAKKNSADLAEIGRLREQASAERNNDNLGKLIDTLNFDVYTANSENGITRSLYLSQIEV